MAANPADPLGILFTSAGRRVELLDAFRVAFRALGVSGRIVVSELDPLAPALQRADSGYIVPPIDDPGYIPALVDICRRESVRLIFPLVDPDIPALAQARAQLEATGARLAALRAEAAQTTYDKLATIEFFGRHGVPHPKTWTARAALEADPTYPLFLKPRYGSAGRHAYKVANRDDLEGLLAHVPDPIVQEFIEGPEITNDVACSLQGEVWAVVSRRRIEVRWGEVAKGITEIDAAIHGHCQTIARGLQAVGPITVQCLRGAKGPLFTEVNARFGGGVPLAIAAGVNSPAWYVAEAAGLPVSPPPIGTYEAGLSMTRYDQSFFLKDEEVSRIARRRV